MKKKATLHSTVFARCKAWTLVRIANGDLSVLKALASWATTMGFPASPKAQPVELEKQVFQALKQVKTPELCAVEIWLHQLKTDSNALPPGGLQDSLIT